MSNQPATIVLIHGLWMVALRWKKAVMHYTEKGYRMIAGSWPEMEIDLEEIRRHPSPIARRESREFVSRPTVSAAGASAF